MLRRLTLFALVLSLPTIAAAQSRGGHAFGPPYQGLTLSGWLGVGMPTGRFADDGGDVGDVVSASVPIGFGAYFRFNPHFRLGGFFEVAPLSIDDGACPVDADCSGTSYRMGVEGQYHFAPFRRVDPWLGLGLGYEWANFRARAYDYWSDTEYYAENKFRGMIFPRITGGLDFAVSPHFTLGPYFGYTAGQYSYVRYTGYDSGEIAHKSFHGWFELGVRGSFNL